MALKEDLEYAARYYKENREEILKKRKSRYQEDETYRASVMEAARARSKRVAIAKRQFRLENPPKIKKKRRKRHIKTSYGRLIINTEVHRIEYNGLFYDLEMVTSHQVAQILGRRNAVIPKWEEDGIIPPALYRGNFRVRLYTLLQYKLLRGAIRAVKQESPTLWITKIGSTSFPRRAKRIWKKYPQGVDFTNMEPV